MANSFWAPPSSRGNRALGAKPPSDRHSAVNPWDIQGKSCLSPVLGLLALGTFLGVWPWPFLSCLGEELQGLAAPGGRVDRRTDACRGCPGLTWWLPPPGSPCSAPGSHPLVPTAHGGHNQPGKGHPGWEPQEQKVGEAREAMEERQRMQEGGGRRESREQEWEHTLESRIGFFLPEAAQF